jgi:hypothetical protein
MIKLLINLHKKERIILMKKLYLLLSLLMIIFITGCGGGQTVKSNSENDRTDQNNPVENETKHKENKKVKEESQEGDITSRSKPAKIGETVVNTDGDSFELIIALEEVIRGDKAWELCKQENTSNPSPEEGMEYILAKFQAKVNKMKTNESLDINEAYFNAYTKDGTRYGDILVCAPNELNTEVYQGEEAEGYICFQVKKGDKPLIRFNSLEGYVWFSTNK